MVQAGAQVHVLATHHGSQLRLSPEATTTNKMTPIIAGLGLLDLTQEEGQNWRLKNIDDENLEANLALHDADMIDDKKVNQLYTNLLGLRSSRAKWTEVNDLGWR